MVDNIFNYNHVDASSIDLAHLDIARTFDILFGHQSVGDCILDGMNDLSTADPTRYSITTTGSPTTSWFDNNNGIGDFYVGSNGNPQSKADEFEDVVDTQDFGSHIHVAIMKFCYTDISPNTIYTGNDVWDIYQPEMESLIALYPSVHFVWTTCPLKTTNNSERHAFNVLLRDYIDINGGWLWDIADIEAHEPDGTPHTDGGYPALYDGYTTDGGHLDDAGNVGRDRTANSLWWLLSSIAESEESCINVINAGVISVTVSTTVTITEEC